MPEGFCDTAVRGVGSGWHFAPPPSCSAVMIMFFFARAACYVRVHASCNLVRPDARAECFAAGTEFCF